MKKITEAIIKVLKAVAGNWFTQNIIGELAGDLIESVGHGIAGAYKAHKFTKSVQGAVEEFLKTPGAEAFLEAASHVSKDDAKSWSPAPGTKGLGKMLANSAKDGAAATDPRAWDKKLQELPESVRSMGNFAALEAAFKGMLLEIQKQACEYWKSLLDSQDLAIVNLIARTVAVENEGLKEFFKQEIQSYLFVSGPDVQPPKVRRLSCSNCGKNFSPFRLKRTESGLFTCNCPDCGTALTVGRFTDEGKTWAGECEGKLAEIGTDVKTLREGMDRANMGIDRANTGIDRANTGIDALSRKFDALSQKFDTKPASAPPIAFPAAPAKGTSAARAGRIRKKKYPNGDVYEGELKHGKREGRGKMRYANGNVYEGEWKEDIRCGHGIYRWPDGDVFEGEFRNDKPNGRGTRRYADGDVYEGEWKNGERHGHGKMCYANGDVYEGEWRWNRRNGHGIYRWPNGDVYEGDFKDGLSHGYGIYRWSDGEVYEGEYKNDKRNGYGVDHYADGDVYEGEFRNDKFNGHGVYHYANGEVYEGDFKGGLSEGHGIYRWPDGKVFEGEWKDDKREGHGKMRWPNGDRFEGEFRNDERNGYGTYRYADGRVQCGIWWDGEFDG